MKHLKLIFGLFLAGITVLFVIQNVAVVEIRLLFWSVVMSRALLVFFGLGVGICIGWLLHGYFARQRKRSSSRL